ncbi:efflux RND transporter periplasmic adaptor subunit [Paenibacillus sp. IB182496]|uniref:Efflux RND transporter periplasmic adaptor subunit n=1 Tax=Paenibacillus sabuli TaxID=2772509 RepID=A0A927BRH9_9BACL|nr:efflux RND transporter periplasmic adaptor subunit [Paenibacillus sabuli]MBD2845426.1 efflux RND transporter periplasmic adaptor subunit [Paenibacillus sabuli]
MEAEAAQRKRKRRIQLAAALFFGVLALVTFFSNTFQQLTLPKVKTENATFQKLTFTVEGSGTLQPRKEEAIYDASGWPVHAVTVEVGDEVEEGQRLVELDASGDRDALLDEEARLEQQQLRLEQLELGYKLGIRDGAPEDGQQAARTEMESLRLDMEIQARTIARLKEKLRVAPEALVAPCDGIVTELHAVPGSPGTPGQPVMKIANRDEGMQWQLTVEAEQVRDVTIGEAVEQRLLGDAPADLTATVAKVEDAGEPMPGAGGGDGESAGARKVLTFLIHDSRLKGGEQVEMAWERDPGYAGLTIAKDAVHHDQQGDYVYLVDARKSPLGNQFVIQKRYVTLGEADQWTQIVANGITEKDEIVTASSEPLSEGDRIRQ